MNTSGHFGHIANQNSSAVLGHGGKRAHAPVVAVGELHVHAVTAQEGPAVERRLDVGRVRDGLAHEHGAGERRLLEAARRALRAAGVHPQLARAVQHLPRNKRRPFGASLSRAAFRFGPFLRLNTTLTKQPFLLWGCWI